MTRARAEHAMMVIPIIWAFERCLWGAVEVLRGDGVGGDGEGAVDALVRTGIVGDEQESEWMLTFYISF